MAVVTKRAVSLLGAGTLTLIQNASVDDNYLTVALPFAVPFDGTSYSTVYVGSNSYVTFGGGSGQFSGLSASSPALPGIFICSADRSYQRVYAGSEDGNATFRIRFEGSSTTTGTIGSPNMVWEMTFTAATPGIILIDVGTNAAASSGMSTVKSASAPIADFPTVQVNAGFTFDPNGVYVPNNAGAIGNTRKGWRPALTFPVAAPTVKKLAGLTGFKVFTGSAAMKYLAGTVKENDTPVVRIVRAYRRDTGELLSSTTSAANGSFSLPTNGVTGECFVVAFASPDGPPAYNAVIYDGVIPV